MRVVFLGLPLAGCLLHADGHQIVLAGLSRSDTPGRRRLRRLLGPERVLDRPKLDRAFLARVRDARPELVVSWFWTNKIPPALVELAPLGAFGVHPSLLPRHRGPDPTSWAILAGDAVTGVTAHRIAPDYDTGAILARRELAIDPAWNAWQLAKALDRPSLSLLREVCARFACGDVPAELPQDEALATEAPFLDPDGEGATLRFGDTTERCLRVIRALAPSPGAATEIGGHEVTVLRAVACPAPAVLEAPGEAAMIRGRLVVRTADAALALLAVERGGETLEGEAIAALLAG